MKFKFRRSELLFLTLGVIMMGTSIVLLTPNRLHLIKTAPSLTSAVSSADAFESSYSGSHLQQPLPNYIPSDETSTAPAPSVPQATPTPTATPSPSATSVPASDLNSAPLGKTYLLHPAARAVLSKIGNPKKGYPVKFKFEISPASASGIFELKFKEEMILSKPISGSPNGLYEVSVMIKKPGMYSWRVITRHAESEAEVREVTIRK